MKEHVYYFFGQDEIVVLYPNQDVDVFLDDSLVATYPVETLVVVNLAIDLGEL